MEPTKKDIIVGILTGIYIGIAGTIYLLGQWIGSETLREIGQALLWLLAIGVIIVLCVILAWLIHLILEDWNF